MTWFLGHQGSLEANGCPKSLSRHFHGVADPGHLSDGPASLRTLQPLSFHEVLRQARKHSSIGAESSLLNAHCVLDIPLCALPVPSHLVLMRICKNRCFSGYHFPDNNRSCCWLKIIESVSLQNQTIGTQFTLKAFVSLLHMSLNFQALVDQYGNGRGTRVAQSAFWVLPVS